jgi:hypothetical protein
MDETTKTEGSTTINQYPNNNGWGGPWGGGWGGYGYPVAVPAYGGYGNGFGDLMRGFGGNINIGRGGGMTGTALGLAIAALGLPVVGALAGRGFGWGGNGGPGCENLVTKDYLGLVKENATLNSVIAQKDAKIYTDEKISDVMKFLIEWRQRQEIVDNTAAAEVATLKAQNAAVQAQLGSMLGTYIQPNVMLPSQAVATQITAAKAATASGS